jgi:16S rRNA (guanine1516-N2)-methyltransferase
MKKTDQTNKHEYQLIVTPDYTGLQQTDDPTSPPFYIDFLSGKMGYRSQHASLRKELLARTIGFSPRVNPTIIDATAGLGRDSFILASLGFHVTMIERSPLLFALLQDALNRAHQDHRIAPIAARLKLIHADAKEWLPTHAAQYQPQVIYLDPMFPERKKSAAVKKEMVILQDILGKDMDAEPLFEAAFSCATHRVVVKRPRLAATITALAPSFSMTGKSSRFDIYLV